MIIDLHSHYPMHVAAEEGLTRQAMVATKGRSFGDKLRALALRVASHNWNTRDKGGGPAVTSENLATSNLRTILSVLYCPFDEMDLSVHYGSAPRRNYIANLLKQLEQVEQVVQANATRVVVARTLADVDRAHQEGKVAIIHAVEGGFPLGGSTQEVTANVERLAERRVAYITVAHLFWRRVATNAPALPFLADWLYRTLFPQPKDGLEDLGRAAVTAMVAGKILVDLTHLSSQSFTDTMALLDELDPAREVPVVATHAACRIDRLGYEYNLTDDQIRAVAARRGVIGLIACAHYMTKSRKPKPEDTPDILFRHIDHIHQVTGSHEFTAVGSDQDGFIKPALPGLATPDGYTPIEAALQERYGPVDAQRICAGNARRLLEYWNGAAGSAAPSPQDHDAHVDPANP